ncbi:ABC-F family ATP-binding cassette domain-containing protein [Mycoplasmatota bacterium]|nr:ABC-F family ATP-binding cassette domain-containing protein [Mycoplasmatota bacterium]
MLLMRIRNIKKDYGLNEVLKDVNFDIKKDSILGLVGLNGAGKTTLAKIISGIETYDSGSIECYSQKIKVGYLKQSTEFNDNNFSQMLLDKNKDLGQVFETSSLLGLKKLNQWSYERINNLSGGEKTKISLAEVFNENSDLLILDEPTNHLDYMGIDWLIEEIKKCSKALLIISHDRFFLDQVTDEIVELEDGVVRTYHGNYSQYRKTKEDNYLNQLHQYKEHKKRERHIDEEINRLKKWSHIGHRDSTKKEGFKEYWRMKVKKKDIQIKSAIKRLEKLKEEGIEKPKEESKVLFEFVSESKAGKGLLTAKNLSKSFFDKTLFKDSDFYIKRGEKVGLIGINGCGKTTLIKMILRQVQADKGELWVSDSAKIAYLSQDVLDLDDSKSVEEIIKHKDKTYQTKIRTMLASSGITSKMIRQKISSLSLGERTRIKLVFLILQENNVLILDEPTNHLDLHSRERLEETLDAYTGTMLIASHDRYLLEKITDKLLIFEDEKIIRIECGYKAYKDREKKVTKDQKAYELMIIQNRITYILGELSKYKETDQMYFQLDQEFKDLINKKKELLK